MVVDWPGEGDSRNWQNTGLTASRTVAGLRLPTQVGLGGRARASGELATQVVRGRRGRGRRASGVERGRRATWERRSSEGVGR